MPASTSKVLKLIPAFVHVDSKGKDGRTSYIFKKAKECTLVAWIFAGKEVQSSNTYTQNLAP